MIESRPTSETTHASQESPWKPYPTTSNRSGEGLTFEEFRTLPLTRQFSLLAGRLAEMAALSAKDQLNNMSNRKKLAIAGVPLVAAGGLGLWYGNTPHELGSTTVGIEVGDGGIQTTCDAVDVLAGDLGLNPENADNCVYAGQDVNRELAGLHPNKPIQPGELITVTLSQSKIQQAMNDYSVTAKAATKR